MSDFSSQTQPAHFSGNQKFLTKVKLLFFRNNPIANFALVIILLLLAIGYIVPIILNLDPFGTSSELLLSPGTMSSNEVYYLLGTDDLGRDLFSRLVIGARSSLNIGFFIVLVSAFVGTSMGLVAGVYGGAIDAFIMRLTDVIMSLPSILLAIVIVAVLGGGLVNAVIAVIIVSMPRYIRVVRSVAMSEMKKQYVVAAQSFGIKRFRILWSEILPNCRAPVIVQSTLGFSEAVLDIAALGFLGLGARPPAADWGAMLADARTYIESAPYLVVLPGVCILITVLCFNIVGDALRDRFDPKLGDSK
ncbi:ABC transporter permease [Aliikangiella coralliicola]|uniref:ABC transporter permease n=1 Tax=Aliikangiella coralliicola TaxID=2592383 RepID=A0A545U676_9GAMM|nr:ABC transporter permease [Aliikangiella coralliicola]TQV84972.1 ABC transporter permease [Aliikangiella coralliicola]